MELNSLYNVVRGLQRNADGLPVFVDYEVVLSHIGIGNTRLSMVIGSFRRNGGIAVNE